MLLRKGGGVGARRVFAAQPRRAQLGGIYQRHCSSVSYGEEIKIHKNDIKVLPRVKDMEGMSESDLKKLLNDEKANSIDAAWAMDLCMYLQLLKPLPKPLVMHILERSVDMHSQMPNILDLKCALIEKGEADPLDGGDLDSNGAHPQVTVVGDTHGQYFDVMNLLSERVSGFPSSSNPYVFNGDMVDRGVYSFEVIFALLAIKLADPRSVYILRGNHETSDMNAMYGFQTQVLAVYDDEVLKATRDVFKALPIAATINSKVFIVHGGIGKETSNSTLGSINDLDRFHHSPPFHGGLSELLWSDPTEKIKDISKNKQRGAGWVFGKDATDRFLALNKLDMIVRSHECRQQGFSVNHEGKCITIFSAPNYCDSVGNLGAVLRFTAIMPEEMSEDSRSAHGDATDFLEASILQFEAVRHPFSKVVEEDASNAL